MIKRFFYLITMRGNYSLILNRLRAEGCKVLIYREIAKPRHAHAVIYANHPIDFSISKELARYNCYVHFKILRNQADIADAIKYVRHNEEFHARSGGGSMSDVEERIEKLEKTVEKLVKAVKKLAEERKNEEKQVKANRQRLEVASMTFAIKESKYENKVLLVITAGKQSIYRPLSYSELKQIANFFANLEIEETANNSNRTAKRKSRAKRKKLSEATE